MLNHESLVAAPVQENDAGVLLKADGSFKVFTTAKYGADPEAWPDWQRKQGRTLQILAFVLAQDGLLEQIGEAVDQLEAMGVPVGFDAITKQ